MKIYNVTDETGTIVDAGADLMALLGRVSPRAGLTCWQTGDGVDEGLYMVVDGDWSLTPERLVTSPGGDS